ncbi:MAG TPA: hypothetical protein VN693_00015 [Rhodanobacteraceae bacterium]|nr:hypothetical protein [Rhodanobacteraceae bacterium]
MNNATLLASLLAPSFGYFGRTYIVPWSRTHIAVPTQLWAMTRPRQTWVTRMLAWSSDNNRLGKPAVSGDERKGMAPR